MPRDKNLHKAMLWSTEGLERPLESDHAMNLRFELKFISLEYADWTASTALNEYSRLGGLLRTTIGDPAFDAIENHADIAPLLRGLVGGCYDIVITHRNPDRFDQCAMYNTAMKHRTAHTQARGTIASSVISDLQRYISVGQFTALGLAVWACLSYHGRAAASEPPHPESSLQHLATIDFETGVWPESLTQPRADHRAEIVVDPDDPENHVLRVTFLRGTHYGASMHIPLRDADGVEPQEALLRYRIRFDPGWHTSSSGKLPGFSGTYGRAGWGGRPSDGYNGWSVRGMFSPTVRAEHDHEQSHTPIGAYIYHVGIQQTRPGSVYGEGLSYHSQSRPDGDPPMPLEHGRWYIVEQYIKLNSISEDAASDNEPHDGPGRADGVIRARINGVLAFERTDLGFRHTDALRIQSVWLDFYHGGKDPAPRDLVVFIDDLEISVGENK